MPDVTIKYAPFATIHSKGIFFSYIEVGFRIFVGPDEVHRDTAYIVKGWRFTRRAERLFDTWVDYMMVVDTAVKH